jgi:N-acetylglucosaminyl-diphospho-decaprenol L-rhamnosyltransferase
MEESIPWLTEMPNLPTNEVLVIIVNYNGGPGLMDCVASVLAQSAPATIVVVDNGSTDRSDITVNARFREVIVHRAPHNLGFGAAVNLAASEYPGSTIVVLNPDVVLREGCLQALLVALASRPGVVGPILHVSASGSSEAGLTVNHTGMPTLQTPNKAPLYVPGCALVTSRRIFEQVGGFDDRYFLFVEDVEFCWRALLAGFDVSVAFNAEANHEGGGSAEGGYLRPGARYRTSDMRISLRERNDIALMIACAPWWWLPFTMPLLIGHCLAVAAGALATRRPRLALSIVEGIGWNFRELPASIHRRHSLKRSPDGCRKARARLTSGSLLVRTIREHGLPDIR